MAFLVEMQVSEVSREQYDRTAEYVEAAIDRGGGPPAGLMMHVTGRRGDGVVLCSVFGREDQLRAFYDDVVVPSFVEEGLRPAPYEVTPVWTFARP